MILYIYIHTGLEKLLFKNNVLSLLKRNDKKSFFITFFVIMQGSLLTDFDEIGLFDAFLHEMNKFGRKKVSLCPAN